jgi:guanylate kinase
VAEPRLLVISGPSGAGKSSLAERLLADPRFGRALTATTRKPRSGEVHEVHYRFLEENAFREGLARGEFLEHAEVYGRLYGTPRETPTAVLSSGRHCVLVIDVQGAASVRREVPAAKFVFVKAPSVAELRRRLSLRALDGPEAMERRLAVVEREMAEAPSFDLVVVNDDLERTARQVAGAVGVNDLAPVPSGAPGRRT